METDTQIIDDQGTTKLSENFTTVSWNNLSHGLYDRAMYLGHIINFQYAAWGVAGNSIAALGFLGNMLSIIVLAHRRMRSSTSCYLIALAVYDSLVLVSLVLFMALPVVHMKTNNLQWYYDLYPYLHPFAYPLALTSQTCSIYTTVGFTIERYIAVCHPLKAATWCTISRARKAILIILCVSILYNIPRMLEYRFMEYTDPLTNHTKVKYYKTDLGMSEVYQHVYFIYLNMTIMLICPFTVLAALNALLIKAVHQSQKTQRTMNHVQHRENNLTMMLISVIIVFLICQVPSIIDNILAATLNKETLNTLPFVKGTVISSLCVIMNSAANFYLYCLFGRKFRQVFSHVLCSCLQRRQIKQHDTILSRGSVKNGGSYYYKGMTSPSIRKPHRENTKESALNQYNLNTNKNNNSLGTSMGNMKTCVVKSQSRQKSYYMEIEDKDYQDISM